MQPWMVRISHGESTAQQNDGTQRARGSSAASFSNPRQEKALVFSFRRWGAPRTFSSQRGVFTFCFPFLTCLSLQLSKRRAHRLLTGFLGLAQLKRDFVQFVTHPGSPLASPLLRRTAPRLQA